MEEPENGEDVINVQKTSRVTVEPMLLLNLVGMGAMFVTYQSFIINTICTKRNEKPNTTVVNCNNLQAFKAEEEEVEREAVEYLAYRKMLETSILIFYSLFLGDWMKKNHGSKSMMVLPIVGFMLASLYLFFLTLFPSIHPGFIVLTSLPAGLGGANFALFLSANNYITRISTTEHRSFRLAVAEGSAILGFPIGLFVGVEMGKASGFQGVFLLCACLHGIALVYTMLNIKNDGPTSYLSINMFRGICNMNSLKGTAKVCYRPRDGSTLLLFLIYLIWSIRVFTFTGLENVLFLYTRLKFEWSSVEFTTFAISETVLTVVGIIIVTFLGIQFLKLPDAILGVLGTFCTFCAALIFAFASVGWVAYLALAFQMFGGIISIIVRSLLSKLVDAEEVASALIWMGVLEAVVPIVSAPLYGIIYTQSLATLSNAVFLVTAAGSGISCFAFMYISAAVPLRKEGTCKTKFTASSISLETHLE